MLIAYSEILKKYDFKPTGILHLGAHEAEEANDYIKSGVENVLWIEGNPELITNLKNKLKSFPSNKVFNLIVSDVDNKDINLNVTNATMSSSILDLAEHKIQHPGIDVVKTIALKTTRLDTFFKNNPDVNIKSLDFLNIDIQGAELLALKGLGNSIQNFKFIYTEINVENLYDGCALLEDIDQYLGDCGFKRMETEITEWLWGDALYMKTEMTNEEVASQVEDAKKLRKKYLSENKALENIERIKLRKELQNKSQKFTFKSFLKRIPYLKKIVNIIRS